MKIEVYRIRRMCKGLLVQAALLYSYGPQRPWPITHYLWPTFLKIITLVTKT